MTTWDSPGGRESTGAMSADAATATCSSRSVPETADVMAYALSEEERNELAAREQTIKQGLKSFVEVGNALVIIRDDRLYRAEHSSFGSCRARWQMGGSRAYQLIEASAITAAVSTIVDTPPTNEGQARELTGLDPVVAAEVVERAAETGPLTATSIREARQQVAPKPVRRPPYDVPAAITRYPDLAHYADRPVDVQRLATSLDGYDEPERSMRLDNLRKSIAADNRTAITDAFRDKTTDLMRIVKGLTALAADDRFSRNKEEIANQNGNALRRAIDVLTGVAELLGLLDDHTVTIPAATS